MMILLFILFAISLSPPISDAANCPKSPDASRYVTPGADFEVSVIHNLPDNHPMHVHCFSGDKDMYRTLYPNQTLSWRFKMNFFMTTLFACRVKWNSKNSAHEVFNGDYADCCKLDLWTNPATCVWLIKDDGWWFANSIASKTLTSEYAW